MSDEIADLLADGREYIEKNGWWKNRLLGPNGRQACALGGLLFSQGMGEEDINTPRGAKIRQAMITLAGVIKQYVPAGRFSHADRSVDVITGFNDKIAKDRQEVLDLFAKAEKIERAGFDPDA